MIGTTGCGKTTLAGQLAGRLGLRHIELDALHWEPNWTTAAPEVFRARVATAVREERWATDGNYSQVRDIVWQRADTVAWLDYPLWLILMRLWRRTVRRVVTREQLWNGNQERLSTAFFSRDSLFLWALQTYGRRRREYPILLAQPAYAHLMVIHLKSPHETKCWLSSLPTS